MLGREEGLQGSFQGLVPRHRGWELVKGLLTIAGGGEAPALEAASLVARLAPKEILCKGWQRERDGLPFDLP